MKTLSKDELDILTSINSDINTTIISNFNSSFLQKKFFSFSPILVSLYFKILSHDPKNKNWKNRDMVFPLNEEVNIVKNIVEIHADYAPFTEIKNYLKENNFENIPNSLSEAIGHCMVDRDNLDRHKKYFYIIMNEKDLYNNFSSFEYVAKNNLHKIISILYTHSDKKDLNRENKLNGKLISAGFDTLVINGESLSSICDALVYAKKLDKPTIILANLN